MKIVKISKKYILRDDGRVFNIKTGEEFIPSKVRGYPRVCVSHGKTEYVHRLVAKNFIPNPDNLPYVDHINRIRDDNRVENLRWVTALENSNNTQCNLDTEHKPLIQHKDNHNEYYHQYYQLNPEQYEHQKELCRKWRQEHREEYNARRRLRRHSMKTL